MEYEVTSTGKFEPLTKQEIELLRCRAVARQDVRDNRKKFWQNTVINQKHIDYIKKSLKAPDVNLFLAVI